MSTLEQYIQPGDLHPIDIVESLAEHNDWDFDRIADDQIAMAVKASWRTYTVTLAWSHFDESLRLVCTYEMDPPEEKLAALYETLNCTNDMCWTGGFTYWPKEKLMVYRYGLLLSGGTVAAPEQIDRMLSGAVMNCERFYPAFQLVLWADRPPAEAMKIAIAEAYGRA